MAISVEANNESNQILYIKFPISVFDYQQIWILQKYFHVRLHHKISRKSIQW